MGKIEVYIKNEKVTLTQGLLHPLDEHPCLDRNISRTESVLSDRDKLAFTCVEQFASERSLPIEVYDVHTYRGRLRAFLNERNKNDAHSGSEQTKIWRKRIDLRTAKKQTRVLGPPMNSMNDSFLNDSPWTTSSVPSEGTGQKKYFELSIDRPVTTCPKRYIDHRLWLVKEKNFWPVNWQSSYQTHRNWPLSRKKNWPLNWDLSRHGLYDEWLVSRNFFWLVKWDLRQEGNMLETFGQADLFSTALLEKTEQAPSNIQVDRKTT